MNKDFFLQHVILNEIDHQDFINIIEKLVPLAPDFAVLLESQLLNAKDMDSRGCRWNKKMITLCLHLWAKLVPAFKYKHSIFKIRIRFGQIKCIY